MGANSSGMDNSSGDKSTGEGGRQRHCAVNNSKNMAIANLHFCMSRLFMPSCDLELNAPIKQLIVGGK